MSVVVEFGYRLREGQGAGAGSAPTEAVAFADWGRCAGPPVAQGCSRSSTRRVEWCQGGVAGGIPAQGRATGPAVQRQSIVESVHELQVARMAPILPEMWESVAYFWTAPTAFRQHAWLQSELWHAPPLHKSRHPLTDRYFEM